MCLWSGELHSYPPPASFHQNEMRPIKSRFLGLFWDDRNVPYLDVGTGYKKEYNCQNVSYSTLKIGDFFLYEIYTQCSFVLSV